MTTKNFFNHRVLWLLIPLLTTFSSNVWGTTTMDFTSLCSANETPTSKSVSPITMTIDNSDATNDAKYYSNGTALRFYSGCEVTFSSSSGNITQIDFASNSNTVFSSSGASADVGTFDGTTWTGNAASVTFSVSATIRISTATFTVAAAATKYTVRFYTASGTYTDITEGSVGGGVTPPTMTTPCDGWAFQGWSTSYSNSTTSTTVLNTVTLSGGKYYPSDATTLYPVYTKTEAGGTVFTNYERVALNSSITAGKYLISTGSYTMAGSGNSGESFAPGTTERTDLEYTVAINGANLTIKGPDDKYIGGSSGSTTLSFSTATPSNNNYKWKYNSTGIQFQGQTTRYIRANSTTDFRNYTSSNGSTTYFYRRVEGSGSVTYYYSFPTCAASCAVPTALTKGSITSTSAHVSWTDAADAENGYYVAYSSSASSTPGDITSSNATYTVQSIASGTKAADLTSLTCNTTYHWWVRSRCSSSTSAWVAGTDIETSACTDPAITVSPTSLTGLNYIVGNGPSAAQNITLGGSYLTGNLTVTAPTNFEVSVDGGSSYGDSKTVTVTSGSPTVSTIKVRLKAELSVGSYGSASTYVTVSGGSATTKNISVQGSVLKPTITADPTSVTGWNAETGSAPSPATKTVSVTGVNLKADISVSLTSGSSYFSIDKSSFTQTAGSASGTITISVLAAAYASAATREGNIQLTSTDATTVNVPISLTVSDDSREKFTLLTSSNIGQLSDGAKLVLVEDDRVYAMNNVQDGTNGHGYVGNTGESTDQFEFLSSYTIIALDATNDVEVLTLKEVSTGVYALKTASTSKYLQWNGGSNNKFSEVSDYSDDNAKWSISVDGSGYAIICANSGSGRLIGYNAGATTSRFRAYSSNSSYEIYAYYQPSTAPTITVSPTSLSGFGYVVGDGANSEIKEFSVSGINLTGNLTVKAPTNYQVSTDGGSSWSSSGGTKTITASGTLSATTVKVRLVSGLSRNTYNDATGVKVYGGGVLEANAKTVSLAGAVTNPFHTVTISAGANGSVSPTGAQSVEEGQTLTVTPTPNTGYEFSSWTVTGTGSSCAGTTFTMGTANATLTANFSQIMVSSITVSGDATVKTGQNKTYTATVLPDGALTKTVTWSVINGTGSATINSSTGVMTANTAGTVTVRATATDGSDVYGELAVTIQDAVVYRYKRLTADPDSWDGEYVIAIESNTTTPSSGTATILKGSDPGESNVSGTNWISGVTITNVSSDYIITLEDSHDDAFTISGGKIKGVGSNKYIYHTSSGGFTANTSAPSGTYTFAYNKVQYVQSTTDLSLRYNSSRFRFYTTANNTGAPVRLYKLDTQYTVTCNTPSNGTLSSNKGSASEGETVTLTVNPSSSSYELYSLTITKDGGGTVTPTKVSETSYTFTMPKDNVTVTATFGAVRSKDLIFNVPSCVTQPSTLSSKATGATVTLPSEPAGTPDGYTFEGWVLAECDGVAVKPTVYSPGSYTVPSGASDINFYALYSEGELSVSGTFSNITTLGNVTAGDYYIISNLNNSSAAILTNTLSGNHIASTTTNPGSCSNANVVWQITKPDSYWRIQNISTKTYVAGTGVAKEATLIADASSDAAKWTLTATDAGYRMENLLDNNNSITQKFLSYSASAGDYRTLNTGNGGDVLYLYKAAVGAVTDNTTYTTSPDCFCDYRLMISTNTGSTWTEAGCFTKVNPADASDHEWQLANFEMPAHNSSVLLKVQRQGYDYGGQTQNWQSGWIPLAELQNTAATYKAFEMEGAVGTLRIYDVEGGNSVGANSNFYLAFLPTYQIIHKNAAPDVWISEPFELVNSATTEYQTAITTAPANYFADNYQYFVGVRKADGSTKFADKNSNEATAKSNTVNMKTMGGMTSDVGGRSGVYQIYGNSAERNWYCQFIPYYVVYYHDVNGDEIEEWRDVLTSSSTTVHAYATGQTGWATSLGGAASATYNAGNVITPAADVHLYQVASTYTVTYSVASETSSNNGTSVKVIQGQSVTLPSITFSCGLYDTHVGWVTGSDIAELDPATKIDEPSTLVGAPGASYTPTADVTLKALYGYDCAGNSGWQKQTSIKAGRYVIAASTYGFAGLESAVSSTTNQGSYVSDVSITDDVINDVTGMHEVEVILGTGGAFAIKYQTGYYMENSGGYFNGNITNLASAYRWKLNASGQIYDASATTMFLQINNSNHKFKCYAGTQTNYAFLYRYTRTGYFTTNPTCATPTELTVTFEKNSPTGDASDVSNMPSSIVRSFSSYPTLSSAIDFSGNNTPTCEGYTIQKWNTAANGSGTDYALDATISTYSGSALTLYAVWDRTYTVTFNDQGTITNRTQASADASVKVPGHTASCDGSALGITWTFAGWSTNSTLSNSLTPGLVLNATTGAANADYIPSDDITLYAVYTKSTSTSETFQNGKTGAYKLSAVNGSGVNVGQTCYATSKYGNGYYCSTTPPATDPIVYFTYHESGTYAGLYTIQSSDGQYASATSTAGSFSWKSSPDATCYLKATAVSGGFQFEWWSGGSGTGSYFTHDSRFGQFRAAGDPLILTPAASSTYFTTMTCDDEFDMTFNMTSGSIVWGALSSADFLNKADGTVISTFPTATLDGWTFVGWTAGSQYNSIYGTSGYYSEQNSNNVDPIGSPAVGGAIYGGSYGGDSYTMHSDIVMYPVFTKLEDNVPFDDINGGDYYIYYLSDIAPAYGYSQDDRYAGKHRVYATGFTGSVSCSGNNYQFGGTLNCSSATIFTFTKLANGNWTIYDKSKNGYVVGQADNGLQECTSDATGWSLVQSGSKWIMTYTSGRALIANDYAHGATSAEFQNFYTNTVTSTPSQYHYVYLGSCTERIFSSNPTNTPHVEIHGTAKITATNGQMVKATSVLSVTGNNLTTSTVTVASSSADFKLSTSANSGTFAQSITIPVVSKQVAPTAVYVAYSPSETTDGINNTVTVSVKDNPADPAAEATTTAGDIQGRHLPADFVIVAKTGDKWVALPSDLTGVVPQAYSLVTVDNVSDPTKATYANSTDVWNLNKVHDTNGAAQDRWGTYGTNALFVSDVDSKCLYATTAVSPTTGIGTYATAATYHSSNPLFYEWALTSSDLETYTLVNQNTTQTNKTLTYNPSTQKWGMYASGGSNIQEVRLLPVDNILTDMKWDVMEWDGKRPAFSGATSASGSIYYKITNADGTVPSGSATSKSYTRISGDIVKPSSDMAIAANAGRILMLFNASSSPTQMTAIEIPHIVTSAVNSSTLSSYDGMDVVVRPGGKITADDSDRKFKTLTVYPGGKINIPTGKKIDVKQLMIRGGYSFLDNSFAFPEIYLTGTGDMTGSTNAIYDYFIDNAHFYLLTLPYDVALTKVTDEIGYDNFSSWIQYYDGTTRASGDQVSGWIDYDGTEDAYFGNGGTESGDTRFNDDKFEKGRGYLIAARPRRGKSVDNYLMVRDRSYAIVRFPLGNATKISNNTYGELSTKSIDVTAPGFTAGVLNDGVKPNNAGWNFVGNPFLSSFGGAEGALAGGSNITLGYLAKTPNEDGSDWNGNYEWKEKENRYITKLNPITGVYSQGMVASTPVEAFNAFFIQTKVAGTLTFAPEGRVVPSMPALRAQQEASEIAFEILLSDSASSDNTGLLIGNAFSEDYEFGDDLTKVASENQLAIYTQTGGYDLAFNAIPETVAAQPIPVGFTAPDSNAYVISLKETASLNLLESVVLKDYEKGGFETDLLVSDYEFNTHAVKQNNTRFTITVKVKHNSGTLTDIDTVGADGFDQIGIAVGTGTITLHGVPADAMVFVYDMTGKLLHNKISTDERMQLSVPQGVYNIRVQTPTGGRTLRTVVR